MKLTIALFACMLGSANAAEDSPTISRAVADDHGILVHEVTCEQYRVADLLRRRAADLARGERLKVSRWLRLAAIPFPPVQGSIQSAPNC